MTSSESVSRHGGRPYMPYVFTEQGIAMLSAVLKSDIAIDVSIKIVDDLGTYDYLRHEKGFKPVIEI